MILLSRNGNVFTMHNTGFYLRQLIRYIQYRLKAKGRHGTHSPFVYAFVEDVLRDKKKGYSSRFIARESKARQLDLSLSLFLFKTLHYLQAEHVALPGKAESYAAVVTAANARVKLQLNTDDPAQADPKEIIIIDMQDISEDLLFELLDRRASFTILLLTPHHREHLWQKAIAHERVLMSIDCWKAGLLIRNKSFKAKQHFHLR